MTEPELTALLDVHDSLVKSCVDAKMSFEEFLALYNDFPRRYALDGHEANPEERDILRRSRRRITFHLQVAEVLSGTYPVADVGNSLYEQVGRFAPAVGLMRLRELTRRHPDFRAEPGSEESS
jgi:hypothetical protein